MRALTVLMLLLFLYLAWLLLLVPRSPCEEPLSYEVVQVDAGFDLNMLDVSRYAADAAALWNQAAGQTVLQESGEGEIRIRLVFDQRQRDTLHKSYLEGQVKNQQQELGGGKESIEALQQRYQQESALFKHQQDSFRARLDAYNREIEHWNRVGGADQMMVASFNQQQRELERERDELNRQLADLRDMEQRLSHSVEQHNQMVEHVNEVVDKLNQDVGEEFEEGNYDPKTRTITIYQYRDKVDLKRVLAHEMGHALMLPHVNDKEAIMYYLNTYDRFELAPADVAALRQVCRLD